MELIRDLTFRTVGSYVRPQRVVTLIDSNDADWKETALRVIEWYSQMWGGEYNLIVPTDGKSIDDKFWRILKVYDPDYVYVYHKTLHDLRIAHPEKYQEYLDLRVRAFQDENPDSEEPITREVIEGQAYRVSASGFFIEQSLIDEIFSKTNPFYEFEERRLRTLRGSEIPSFPLTHIDCTFEKTYDQWIIDIDAIGDALERLILYSVIGSFAGLKRFVRENTSSRIINRGINSLPSACRWMESQIVTMECDSVVRLISALWQIAQRSIDSPTVESLLKTNMVKLGNHNLSDIAQFLPFALSMRNLDFAYHLRNAPSGREPIILIAGESIKDFCLYYDLSRLKEAVFWLPTSYLPSSKNEFNQKLRASDYTLHNDYLVQLVLRLSSHDIEKRGVIITSSSLDCEAFPEIIRALADAQIVRLVGESLDAAITISMDIGEMTSRNRLVMQVKSQTVKGSYFSQGESVEVFEPPMPIGFRNIARYEHRWIAELEIAGHTYPAHPTLSTTTVRFPNYTKGECRISSNGICFFCPHIEDFGGAPPLIRPKLGLLDPFEIFMKMFSEPEMVIRHSDKGQYQRECLKMVGSLKRLAALFKREETRALLGEYLKTPLLDREFTQEKGSGMIVGDKRRCLGLCDIARIVSPEDPTATIDALLQDKVLRRGLVLKCRRCLSSAWYPMDQVSEKFVCDSCSHEQPLEMRNWRLGSSPPDIPWYYKLDEVFFKAISNNMEVPVLTLAKLEEMAQRSFLHIPEVEVIQLSEGREQRIAEFDICCIIDGKTFLGECKVGDSLDKTSTREKKKLQGLKKIGGIIRCTGYVFATTSEKWSLGTKANIESAFSDFDGQLMIWEKNKLVSSIPSKA